MHRFEADVGPAEGQHQEESQEPADAGAEGGGAEPLEPAQVDLAAAVDAVERDRQLAVEADERVAAHQFAGAFQVGQLELVARDGVAQVAHVQVAVLGHAVEQLFGQLVAGNLLGHVLRL